MRRFTLALILALAAIAGCGDDPVVDGAARVQPAPSERIEDPALRRLREQGSRLLDGGPEAFQARLAELRGRPVVVNQWASWCPPCRAEFPFFVSAPKPRESAEPRRAATQQTPRSTAPSV